MPRYTQPRKTWSYTNDFKIKAVKLSEQEGLQVKQVAEGLDIHPFMLSRWRKEYRDGKLKADGQRRVGVNKKSVLSMIKNFPRMPSLNTKMLNSKRRTNS